VISPAKDPASLGISFVENSTSTLIMRRDGRTYLIDLASRTINEADPQPGGANQPQGAAVFAHNCAQCHGPDGKGLAATQTPNFTDPKVQASLTDEQILTIIHKGKPGTIMPAWAGRLSEPEISAVATYVRSLGSAAAPAQGPPAQPPEPKQNTNIFNVGDDVNFTLPTGRRLDRHGVYVDFTHRFADEPTFSGAARGPALLGLDSFALASFGFRYGFTKNFSGEIFRSPTFISRPIQMVLSYNFLNEADWAPLNVVGRFSVEGQNNFSRNFTENFELIVSKSIEKRAQFYVVPTVSLKARPLFAPPAFVSSAIPNVRGHNTFSIGVGLAVDVRPTVALVAEVIPTAVNGDKLGIHRPVFSFGVKKKIWRHAFTIGFTQGPGVTISQRSGSRAQYLNQPGADKPDGLFIGFDLMRQLH
jgi:mono/diheme cytochrome c family protein